MAATRKLQGNLNKAINKDLFEKNLNLKVLSSVLTLPNRSHFSPGRVSGRKGNANFAGSPDSRLEFHKKITNFKT